MKYFAYGSNMFTPRLRFRVGSAKPLGVGILNGYQFHWHKRSKKDGSGKCNVLHLTVAGSKVYGVVFEIDPEEKAKLDEAEGLNYGYRQTDFGLALGPKLIRAFSYVAHPDYIDNSLIPYTWYKDFVIAGSRNHGLPAEYVRFLEGQEAMTDPDPERERQEREKVFK